MRISRILALFQLHPNVISLNVYSYIRHQNTQRVSRQPYPVLHRWCIKGRSAEINFLGLDGNTLSFGFSPLFYSLETMAALCFSDRWDGRRDRPPKYSKIWEFEPAFSTWPRKKDYCCDAFCSWSSVNQILITLDAPKQSNCPILPFVGHSSQLGLRSKETATAKAALYTENKATSGNKSGRAETEFNFWLLRWTRD